MASDNEVNDLIGRLSGLTPAQRARIDDALLEHDLGDVGVSSGPGLLAAGKFQVTRGNSGIRTGAVRTMRPGPGR